MFFLQLYGKALFAGFLNGLYIGRKLREKKKYKNEKVYKVLDRKTY